MGRNKCVDVCRGCFCWRAKYTVNDDKTPLPRPKEAEELNDGVPYIDQEERDILIIRKIDPCVMTNGTNHHTSQYDLMSRPNDPQLVVRRGKPFRLDVYLSRPYNEEKDGISFIFTVEDDDKPSYGHGTLVALPLMKKPERDYNWNVVLENATDNVLTVQITPAADCVVAKWKLDIDTKIIGDSAYSYSWETGIYILYNAWCKNDQVYLRNEEWREEAILNDSGIIWRGTSKSLKPVIWKFDQFEKQVLECSLYLVRYVGKIRGNDRADPVATARVLAGVVNSADEGGAVMGNWSNDFTGGTAPTEWLGSKKILQEFYRTKKPVKYGQCWVFSGVLATACRALGIPARPVTNYSSAHDTQGSLTVDYFLDKDGAIKEDLNSDSIWNFHVWVEAWMQRPDLGVLYSGWQAIDATPQEISDDMYRVGPAAVVAVKQAEINRPYDCKFLYAEVNADKVYWRYTGPNQPLKLLSKDTRGIGRLIITKAAGRDVYEDITHSYKYPEKTTEEREMMLRALRQSENIFSRYYLNEEFNDIYFELDLHDDIKIGQQFTARLKVKNRSDAKEHKIHATVRVEVTTYTGKVVGDVVKRESFDITLKPEAETELEIPITYKDYAKRLVDQSSFVVSCLASIEDTKYEYYAQDEFRVRKPDIKFVLNDKPVKGKELTVEVLVENPLPTPIKRGEFTVEGPGLDKPLKLKIKKPVPPGENATATFTYVPTKIGRQSFGAKFTCREMNDVDGYVVFVAEANKEENGTA